MVGLNFKDRVALVPGGSTGIGASTAVKVAVNYFKSEAKATKVANSFDLKTLKLCWWAQMYATQPELKGC